MTPSMKGAIFFARLPALRFTLPNSTCAIETGFSPLSPTTKAVLGAIPYIDSAYIGKDEICVYPTSHWYAIRAIAHKIVFEPLIQKRLYPLQPRAYIGPQKPVHEIAAEYGLSTDSFLLLNPWLLKPILPASRPVTFYVPADSFPTERPQEPLKALFIRRP
jgi:hypothetical protein